MADVVGSIIARSFASITRRPNELFRGMARHPELCCLVLAFVITLIIKYGNSFKAKPVTVPAKQPQYMFSPATMVLDSPRGALVPLIQLLNQEEFVFVMYYAPWCSKSQKARSEFVKAAHFFKGEVKFAAVNCWWPEGECRKRYKFLLFPVFMAYHTKLDGYRYFGLPRAEQMITFIEDLLNPLAIVHTKTEAVEFIAKHETAVLGFFNLSALNSIGTYRQFYYASMRILEKEPFQPTKFLVVTQSEVAKAFNLTAFEDIVMLRLTNVSLVYPFVNNITSSNLVNWVLQNKGLEVVKRLSPEGIKSQVLSVEINKGPAFIMFHVENPLFGTEHGLRVLKDVAFLYKECKIDPEFRGIRTVWENTMRRQGRRYEMLVEMCELSKLAHRNVKHALSCCVSAVVANINSSSKICNVCHHEKTFCRLLPHHLSSVLKKNHPIPLSCRNILLNYSWSEKLSVCCRFINESLEEESHPVNNYGDYKTNISGEDLNSLYFKNNAAGDMHHRRPTDRYVRHHLENLPRKLCDRLALERQQGLKSSWHPDSEVEVQDVDLDLKEQDFKQVTCTSNKSVNFYAMDSQNHWMFYDALGMKPLESGGFPTAVLFDKANEQHYVMTVPFTVSNTMSFILDFEQGKLKRYQQSHGFEQTMCNDQGLVCVKELTSETFLDVVMKEDEDVVVFVYAHWCGFCQTLSHMFLALAQYFSPSTYITFVRINGATNDLPWKYTFDSYPSILFFPARRKSESILFPPSKEITLMNLVRFVFRHTTFDTRLLLASDVCSKTCIQQNLQRSTSLLYALQNKERKLQAKLQEHLDTTPQPVQVDGDSESEGFYSKLSADFLKTSLQEIQIKINHLTKLIEFLKEHENSVISNQELVDLLSWSKDS